jgi:malate dehydrogenase (oxaloacetate-decarboxylating)
VSAPQRRAVAVVSDGSGGPALARNLYPAARDRAPLSGLRSIASLLRERADIDAEAILLDPEGIEELAAQLGDLAAKFDVIYLVGVTRTRAQAAHSALHHPAWIITDWQTRAIALTAALLTTLTRMHHSTSASTVLIIGGDHHPEIAALAVAAGIGEVTSWTPHDAPCFPLSALARRATVVIDALGSANTRRQAAYMVLPPPIIALDDEQPLLALAELLPTRRGTRSGSVAHRSYACARELSARTPHDRLLPTLDHACLHAPR